MREREAAAEWVATSKLKPWAKNPRSNKAAIQRVAESIQRFGFGAPIVARREDSRIIAGHTRWLAARQLKIDDVPVRFLDVSEAEADRLALADNKLGELASWNDDMLADLLKEFGPQDAAFAGWSTREMDGLFERIDSQAERVNLRSGVAISQLGEVYELGEHRLVCGDSSDPAVLKEALAGYDPPRLWCFDPPFDADYSRWHCLESVVVACLWWRGYFIFPWMVAEFVGKPEWAVHDVVFTGVGHGHPISTFPVVQHQHLFVWRKKWWTTTLEALDLEVARTSGMRVARDGRPLSAQPVNTAEQMERDIGLAKPVGEFEFAMIYSPRQSTVLDSCAGSGTGLIAAAKHGRRWVGIELNPLMCDVIRRRWTKWARDLGREVGPGALD